MTFELCDLSKQNLIELLIDFKHIDETKTFFF